MLSSILKTEIASKISGSIMSAFVKMRKYIWGNLIEQEYINNLEFSHDEEIKLLQSTFSKFDTFSNELLFEG